MRIVVLKKNIFRSKCHPDEDVLHCHASLSEDISAVFPYLNRELGCDAFCSDPPSLMFKWHGKLVTLHGRLIAINALKSPEEADAILAVLISEISDIWDRRDEIRPLVDKPKNPQVLQILRLLARKNCGACGHPTCLVHASVIAASESDQATCVELGGEGKRALGEYLSLFGS